MKVLVPVRFRLWPVVAFLPAAALIGVALLVAIVQQQARQRAFLADSAQLGAAAIDLRLGKVLEATRFCATSPDLVTRLDLTRFGESCGRFAALIGAWVVVVETGAVHRQIVNTRSDRPQTLPSYPRAEERPELLAVEEQSRATAQPVLSEVFVGRVYPRGVLVGGQLVRLADDRQVMVYVSLPVRDLSNQMAQLALGVDVVLGLVDPSARIVARSERIETLIFEDVPPWFAAFDAGRKGAALGMPGPAAIGGTWNAGYHPLSVAPGWMALAVQPATQGLLGWRLVSVPSLLAFSGLVLSGLLFWKLADRDRSRARLEETERARAMAEQRDTEKSRLLASFAHDIRGPLISLVTTLDLLDDDRVRGARCSAESLLQLVDDILELAFLGSDAFSLRPSPVDLRQLFGDIALQVRPLADSKGLDLQLDLDPGLPPVVEVDRLRLQQVLWNLLGNAVKYTETGSVRFRVRVEAATDDSVALAFAVTDTGIGLLPEDIPEILREYGRLDRAAERREAGTGLGLAIVQRVLRAMGATLTVESNPGTGSTFGFRLTLPVLAGKADPVAAQPLAGVTVLYAEDEAVIRQVTARRLAEAGARVVEATDGADALARMAALTPDLLLLDLQMPGLGGLAVLRTLRAGGKALRFPVVVLTSHITGPQVAEAREAGADAVLTKPVQIEPLAAAFRARQGAGGRLAALLVGKTGAEGTDLIDPANLTDVFGMLEPAAAAQLLRTFETGLREDFATIDLAIRDGDAAKTARQAHRCLGMCQVMGAVRLARVLMDIEDRAKAGDLAGLADRPQDRERLLRDTLDQMHALLSRVCPEARVDEGVHS